MQGILGPDSAQAARFIDMDHQRLHRRVCRLPQVPKEATLSVVRDDINSKRAAKLSQLRKAGLGAL